jgi:hypothetical protein
MRCSFANPENKSIACPNCKAFGDDLGVTTIARAINNRADPGLEEQPFPSELSTMLWVAANQLAGRAALALEVAGRAVTLPTADRTSLLGAEMALANNCTINNK